MPTEDRTDLKFEIGHVLFIDIVGYSKLLINEQSEQIQKLKEIVRGTEQFRLAEAEGKLLRLPTGDGGALVFRTSPEAPVRCAVEISQELKRHPELRVRMGIHSGPVNEVTDLNEQANVTGAGINTAQRVMDCGDAGHILLSRHVAEDLEHYERWQPYLHDVGECEVKHGRKVALFNFYTDSVGNPDLPEKLQQVPRQAGETQRHNLPVQLSSFIGREAEIAKVKQLLTDIRLLTLTGAGGCGKTRLALEVAADLLAEYPDGAWLVELAPASDPVMVAQLTAQALGISEQAKRSLIEAVADDLRSKRLLLVLDNCEHLLDGSAALADTLLKNCLHLRILATSREAIGIAGERVWQVPSLAIPESAMSLESLRQVEGVRLFRERAVAVQPRFELTETNARAVGEICSRLDGIPLAIELAAARTSALSVAQIAERLQDSFRLLSHGPRTALPRHQTLQSAMDWSYALLSEPEQMLFQRLAVFAGGVDLEALENVCASEALQRDQILDLLTSLVEKSLVLVQEHLGQMRYRMLESIRQYAYDRLSQSGAAPAAHGQHVHYFLRLAQRIKPRLLGSEQQKALEELETEHPNLLTALAWATQHDPEEALKLSNALGWFWERRGYLAEGREWFKRTIAQSPTAPADIRGEAYVHAGRLACWQADYEQAVALTEQGRRLCEQSANQRWLGMALNNLGAVATYRGELAQAVPLLDRALSIGKEMGDNDLIWRSQGDLGVVALLQGDYERARGLVEQSLLTMRQCGDEEGGMLVRILGEIECAFGNLEKATSYYQEALAIGRKLAHKRAVAGALEGLGKIAFDRGDYAKARSFYDEGVQVASELGKKSEYATTLSINLAELAAEEGKFDEARRLCMASLRSSQEAADKESIAAELSICAWLCFASVGRGEPAAQLLGAVEKIRESFGMPLPPRQHVRHDLHLAAIRETLGQETFAEAWTRGKRLSLEEAITYAFSTLRSGS